MRHVGLWGFLAMRVASGSGIMLRGKTLSERVFYLGDPQIGFGHEGWQMDVKRFHAAAARASQGDAVLIAGDLVNNYDNATQMKGFDQVWPSAFEPRTAHLIPGNHDIDSNTDDEAKFTKQLSWFRKNYGADYHSFETRYATFIMINSESLLLPHLGLDGKTPSKALKNETETQWSWIEASLAAAKGRGGHIVACTHHPPFLKTADEDHVYWNWPLEERKRLLGLLADHGVEHVLAGHTHTTTEVSADGLNIYTTAGTARALDDNGCGYRVLTITPTAVSQEYVRIDQGSAELHECTKDA